jgi:hypothetical protein
MRVSSSFFVLEPVYNGSREERKEVRSLYLIKISDLLPLKKKEEKKTSNVLKS